MAVATVNRSSLRAIIEARVYILFRHERSVEAHERRCNCEENPNRDLDDGHVTK
jgi:hypothetical protein